MPYPHYKDYGYDEWAEAYYFYGCAGRNVDGEWWHNDHHGLPRDKYRHATFWEVEPESPHKRIQEMIRGLGTATTRRPELVIAGAHHGVSLCLEGLIKPADLDNATQEVNCAPGHIDVPDIRIGGARNGGRLTVRVIDGDMYELAVADGKGDILTRWKWVEAPVLCTQGASVLVTTQPGQRSLDQFQPG
jgi:hypothetical protein